MADYRNTRIRLDPITKKFYCIECEHKADNMRLRISREQYATRGAAENELNAKKIVFGPWHNGLINP